MILLLSYDLNEHERPSAYEDVKKMITENATSSTRPLFSQWLIETDDSIKEWHERMKVAADANDRWFICEVTSHHQGFLSKDAVKWLKDHLK